MPESQKPLPELEGKDVLIFREGTHHGVGFLGEVYDANIRNTLERGQDIPFAPVEDNDLPAHSLKRRIGAIIPLGSTYEKVGKYGREWWGKLTQVSNWLREQAADRPWPYVSPTLVTKAKEGIKANPASAFIRSLSPTGTPEITPQEAWLSDDITDSVMLSIEVEPHETATTSSAVVISEGKWTLERIDLASKKKPKLGTGARFKKLKNKLAKKGVSDPKALAAWIGRKKYGKKRFAKIAGAARKRKKKGS